MKLDDIIAGATRDQLIGIILAVAAKLAEPTHAPPDDDLLTAEQAAAKLGVSKQFVYRRWRALGGRKIGDATLRFEAAALRDFIKKRR